MIKEEIKVNYLNLEEEIKEASGKEKTQLEKDLKEAQKEKERYIMIFKKMEYGISIKVPIP